VTVIPDLDEHAEAIAAGDPEAFGLWVAAAESPLRRCLRSFATRLDTEAILQECLLRVWQVAPRLQEDGRPNGLLRLAQRIARNLAISEMRRLLVEPVELEALVAEADREGRGGTPAVPDSRLCEIIARCREALTRRPAEALAARLESGGEDPDSILAERLGMRLVTFHQNVSRARALLARCLKRNGIDLDLELS